MALTPGVSACAAALSWAEMIPGVIGQQHESGAAMVMLPAGHNEILIKYLNCNKLLINIGNISGVEAF